MSFEVQGKMKTLDGETPILHRLDIPSSEIFLSPNTLAEIIPDVFKPKDISGISASLSCGNFRSPWLASLVAVFLYQLIETNDRRDADDEAVFDRL